MSHPTHAARLSSSLNSRVAHRLPPARPARFANETEAALRDMAFVLHLTRTVKESILAEEAREQALCN